MAAKTKTRVRGELLTAEEVRDLLKLGPGYREWLKRARHERRIEFTKLPGSRLVRYWKDSILDILDANTREAADETGDWLDVEG